MPITILKKTKALYSASDFTGFSDSYVVPAGSSDVIFTGSVDLILSAGITQQAFDTHCSKMYLFYRTKALFSIT